MLLQDVLKKDNNNLDIFRVVAAFMVIFGHAYVLLPRAGEHDFVGKALAFDYSGSLAVKIFFFLSGLLVTNSLLEKRKIIPFAISRAFRIWPALILVLLITSFVLGPLLSHSNFSSYLANPSVLEYAYKGIIMDPQYDLPGVFQANAFRSVNGSLWTIPFEVFAYLFLAAAFLLGVLKSRALSTLIIALILMDPLVGNKLVLTWLPQKPEVLLLGPCFALGALLALWKDRWRVDAYTTSGTWLMLFLFQESAYNHYFFYLTLFASILFLASRKWFLRLKPSADISYGVYLWGWLVQQVLVDQFPHSSIRFNQFASMLISALLGLASWYLVEKRFIQLGSTLSRQVREI